MSVELTLFACGMGAFFLAMIFYLIFGQLTVRKLRKNSNTKNELGMEFVSGWGILNVAGALALPRWLNVKLRNTPLCYLYANAEILDKYTSVFDRILAIIFYWLFVSSVVFLMLLATLNSFGVFD